MLTPTLKPRRCKHCRNKFQPERLGQLIHTECIEGYCLALREKRQRKEKSEATKQRRAERAAHRMALAKTKTWAEYHAAAQKEVNAMVRARDAGLPCISCGTPWAPDFQAGHYRSCGAAKNLALDPRNIHGQCVQCNLHKHSNAIEYRIGLAARCGIALVEALEADNEPRHNSIDDLQAIRADAIAKTKQLKKEQA